MGSAAQAVVNKNPAASKVSKNFISYIPCVVIKEAQILVRWLPAKCRIKLNQGARAAIAKIDPYPCRKSNLEQTTPFRHNAIPLLNGDSNGDPRWSPRDDKL